MRARNYAPLQEERVDVRLAGVADVNGYATLPVSEACNGKETPIRPNRSAVPEASFNIMSPPDSDTQPNADTYSGPIHN
jgi:hypothetical protein